MLVVAALGTACADPPAPVEMVVQAVHPRPAVLPAGRTLVFDLDWMVDAGFEEGSPLTLPIAGGLHLVGELHVQAIGAQDGGTLAAVWFGGLDTRELMINRETLAVEPEMLVGPRAWFVLDDQGGIADAWFAPEAPALFRHVMGGVLTRIDLRGAAEGTHAVPTAHGLGNVAYVQDGDTVRRQVQSIARFDAMGGTQTGQPEIAGTYDLVVDDDGMPLRIASDERASASDEGWTFGAHDRFSATRTRIDAGVDLLAPDLAAYRHHDPAAAPDYRESEQVLAQRMSGDMMAKDIALVMTAQDGGLLPSPGFISQATGLLRGWPDEAWSIVPDILAAQSHGRQLGFDVLSSAGTPEAQQVMCELLARDDVRGWEELPLLVGRFAFVRRPTSATVYFALGMHTWARTSGDEMLAQAMLYPLGSLARHVERDDPWLAELVHARLVAEHASARDIDDRTAAIAGLGNHGRASDEDLLLGMLVDDDERIRASAVTALRDFETHEVTEAMVVALGDRERAVAMRALDILDRRLEGAEGAARLAEIASVGAHNPELALSMANKLALRVQEHPSVRQALAQVASRTEDRELAMRIADLLEA
jgi:hypothetical protein